MHDCRQGNELQDTLLKALNVWMTGLSGEKGGGRCPGRSHVTCTRLIYLASVISSTCCASPQHAEFMKSSSNAGAKLLFFFVSMKPYVHSIFISHATGCTLLQNIRQDRSLVTGHADCCHLDVLMAHL